jgi:energy-coupling factor transport system permease protein
MNSPPLDPRSKLITAILATGSLMLLDRWTEQAGALGVLLAALWVFQLGRSWLDFLKSLGFAALSFLGIAWLAFDFPTGLVAGLRLLTLGTVFFLFFKTTPPEDLSNGLVKWRMPYSLAFVMTVSMEFVQVLARRAANIRDAQRARGIPLEGVFAMVAHLPAIVGPLLVQAFKLADELAEAMEARGFGSEGRRFRREPRFRKGDWMMVGAGIAVLGLIIWFRSR